MAASRTLHLSPQIVLAGTSRLLRCLPRGVAVECSMAANTVKVAAVQMNSTNDLMANFETCSRLVKVKIRPRLLTFRVLR